jgi:hypothetical protein
MSFSFSFVARTKAAARKLADAQRQYRHVPRAAVDLCQDAIESLPPDELNSLVSVKAHGHVGEAGSSSSSGEVVLEVRRLIVSE